MACRAITSVCDPVELLKTSAFSVATRWCLFPGETLGIKWVSARDMIAVLRYCFCFVLISKACLCLRDSRSGHGLSNTMRIKQSHHPLLSLSHPGLKLPPIDVRSKCKSWACFADADSGKSSSSTNTLAQGLHEKCVQAMLLSSIFLGTKSFFQKFKHFHWMLFYDIFKYLHFEMTLLCQCWVSLVKADPQWLDMYHHLLKTIHKRW